MNDPTEAEPADFSTVSRGYLADAWKALGKVARVLIPSTLLASLFFYFGLRYTHDHYLQYGLDDAGLGFSTTDYAVRSLNVVVQPARLVAVVVIIAVAVHVAVVSALRFAEHVKPGSAERLTRGLGAVLAAAGVTGMLLFWSPGRLGVTPASSGVGGSSACSSASTASTWVGCVPRRPSRLSGLIRRAVEPGEQKVIASVLLAVAVLLVTYGAFEFTRTYAARARTSTSVAQRGDTVGLSIRADLQQDGSGTRCPRGSQGRAPG